MNLTGKQYLAIAMAVLGALAASTGQMTEFLGPTLAKSVASGASFVNMLLGSVLAAILGQGSLVKDVRSMPGVENIEINAHANPTLANLAVDPTENKIVQKAGDEHAIQATANT